MTIFDGREKEFEARFKHDQELYFKVTSQKHRDWVRDTQCPTCLSPCQMNVAAVKQVVPYVKFLIRASREKRRGAAARIPAAAGSISD